jgi:hypothetical protein
MSGGNNARETGGAAQGRAATPQRTPFVASTAPAVAEAVKNKVPLHYLSAKPPVLPLEYGHYIFDDTST